MGLDGKEGHSEVLQAGGWLARPFVGCKGTEAQTSSFLAGKSKRREGEPWTFDVSASTRLALLPRLRRCRERRHLRRAAFAASLYVEWSLTIFFMIVIWFLILGQSFEVASWAPEQLGHFVAALQLPSS